MKSDYHQKDLQGCSFRHQNLVGADFSDADIRGADFTKANLEGANFSNVTAGVQRNWILTLEIASLILSFIIGNVTGFAAIFPGNLLSTEQLPGKELIVIIGFIILAVFLIVLIRHGVGSQLGMVAIVVVALTAILAIAINGDGVEYENILAAIVLQPLSIAFAIVGVLAGSVVLGIIFSIGNKLWLLAVGGTSIAGATLGSSIGGADIPSEHLIIAILITSLEVVILLSSSFYICFRALNRDKRYSLVSEIIIFLCTVKGTSFYKANLTEADFAQAKLEYTNLREASLKRTCWFETKNLHLARVERTYLEDLSIRDLVTSRFGQDQLYDFKDLRGLNLKNAILINASLIGADLSEATLESADLNRSKLVQARLYGTDLTYANLTGAYIQDWAISTDTKLEEVKCEFVYMRLPTEEDPDPWRKPDNRSEKFKEGDFADFIAPIIKTLDFYRQQNVDPRQVTSIFKTLDLYHYKGMDPAAAAIAFKELEEENPEAGLKVVALSRTG